MRILFLSPVQPLLTPGEPLPKWQMQASWVRALRRQGHEVKVVKYTPDDRIRLGWGEKLWWNIRVIRQIGQIREIGLIVYSLGADVLLPWALHYIKAKLGAPLAVLSGVSPIKQGNPRERAMAPLIDLAATNNDGQAREWLKLGAKRAVALPIAGVDPELHYPRSEVYKGPALPRQGRALRDIDILFVGTLTPERKVFFEKLRRLLPDRVKMVVKEFVWEEEYALLMSRAKIGINLLRPEMKHGVNLRAFEIPAFGAMEITGFCRDEWLASGKEVEVFGSVEEAAELVKKYLKNDRARRKMAEAGRERVMREHTFERRAEKLMQELKENG